jgi:hypothetical protein
MKNRFFLICLVLVLAAISCGELGAAPNPSRLTAGEAVTYVIITPLRYAPIFQRLADWKTAKGVPARVITLEEIYKEYAARSGNRTSQIREFLKDAYKTWNLKWVLLGGDTKDEDGELIPVRYARSAIKNTDVPSDLYYANFDGSWDGNNNGIFGEPKDNCDLIPEVHIGRASVNTREKASTFVNKVIAYEKNPPANYVKKAVLVGVDLDDVTRGEREAEMLGRDYLKGFSFRRCYQSQKTTPKHIQEALNSHSPHFVYVGAHGNEDLFDAGGDYSNKEADELKNSFPFIYTSISCLTNYFDKDSLSEHFMNNPDGGAVAYWACSREGWYQPKNEGYYYSILMIKDFYNLLFNDPRNLSNHLGEVVSRARIKYVPEAQKEDGCFRWLVFGMNLLGDPEMPVWTDIPQKLSIQAKADSKQNSVTIRIVRGDEPVDGARVCLRFLDEKTLGITASAKNGIPVEAKLPNWGAAGVYDFGETDKNGRVVLSTNGGKKVIAAKIAELVRLDLSLKDLEAYFKKIRSNTKVYEKLVRDYQNLQSTLERSRKEVRAFFVSLAEAKKFTEIEETLNVIKEGLRSNPAAVGQFQFALKAVTDKLRFDLAQMQADKSGIQLRIMKEILELQKGISAADPSQPVEECGRLKVTSDPEGATVLVNNVPRGTTPCVVENLPFGSYVVKIQAQGRAVQSRTVEISEKKTVVVAFALVDNCSIRGKVTLKDKGISKDIVITLLTFVEEDGKNKEVTLATGTPNAQGEYSFTGIPKKDVYVAFENEGYNTHWKPFNFTQRDQGFHRVYHQEMIPLFELTGQDPSLAGAEISLFAFEKPQYYRIRKIKLKKDGAFAFANLPMGRYQVYAAKAKHSLGYAEFSSFEGEDQKVQLGCLPITAVRMAINAGLKEEGRWDKFDLVKEADGIFRYKLALKAREKPYYFVYSLNLKDAKFSGPYIMDQKAPLNRDLDFLNSSITVKKDAEITFEYDPRKVPVFFETQKNEAGKDRYVIRSEKTPDIR